MSFFCMGFHGVLSSVGGRSLKLTDYYRAEARPRQDRVRPRRGRASKKTASRPPRAEADASRTTSLSMIISCRMARRIGEDTNDPDAASAILGQTRLPLLNPISQLSINKVHLQPKQTVLFPFTRWQHVYYILETRQAALVRRWSGALCCSKRNVDTRPSRLH